MHTHNLAGVREDVLEDTVSLSKSVQGVVSLTAGADVARKDVSGVVTSNGTAILVNVGNVDLNGSMVLGLDDTVSGRALAGNVKFNLYKEASRLASS